jgi:hypothetical protein
MPHYYYFITDGVKARIVEKPFFVLKKTNQKAPFDIRKKISGGLAKRC